MKRCMTCYERPCQCGVWMVTDSLGRPECLFSSEAAAKEYVASRSYPLEIEEWVILK